MKRIVAAERADWRETAASYGFRFHTIDGEPYWDERAYYAFSLEQIEQDLEAPTEAIHEMAMGLVDEIVGSEALLSRLAIPPAYWDWIATSWRRRDPHLYGRMDLAYNGQGPAKLYELNYDTPTALYESAFFQWLWLEQQLNRGVLPAGTDQFNLIQELLVESFGTLAPGLPKPLYFSAVRGSAEDQGTIEYLRDCAEQAGVRSEMIAIEDIGLSRDGRFTDLEDRVIGALFKLYPLEYMFAEEFGPALPGSGIQLIEPPWKLILANKGLLSLLWERFEGHPNLLPARDADGSEVPPGWVEKPFFSREGANIILRLDSGERHFSDGPDTTGPRVLQRSHPLPCFDGHYPLVGSWVIGDRAAGIGMREDSTLITRNTSRFVPHVIVQGGA